MLEWVPKLSPWNFSIYAYSFGDLFWSHKYKYYMLKDSKTYNSRLDFSLELQYPISDYIMTLSLRCQIGISSRFCSKYLLPYSVLGLYGILVHGCQCWPRDVLWSMTCEEWHVRFWGEALRRPHVLSLLSVPTPESSPVLQPGSWDEVHTAKTTCCEHKHEQEIYLFVLRN